METQPTNYNIGDRIYKIKKVPNKNKYKCTRLNENLEAVFDDEFTIDTDPNEYFSGVGITPYSPGYKYVHPKEGGKSRKKRKHKKKSVRKHKRKSTRKRRRTTPKYDY